MVATVIIRSSEPWNQACDHFVLYFQCIQNLASSTLGSILGTYTLSSLLSARWQGIKIHKSSLSVLICQGGDCQHSVGCVWCCLRPLGHRGGESGGQEPQRGQGDDQVHGGGGQGEQGGQRVADHAEWRRVVSGENKVNIMQPVAAVACSMCVAGLQRMKCKHLGAMLSQEQPLCSNISKFWTTFPSRRITRWCSLFPSRFSNEIVPMMRWRRRKLLRYWRLSNEKVWTKIWPNIKINLIYSPFR